MTFAPIKDSDQPWYAPSLFRLFAVFLKQVRSLTIQSMQGNLRLISLDSLHSRCKFDDNVVVMVHLIMKTRPCNIQRFFMAVKMTIFSCIFFDYFHTIAQNIYCEYTLEPPH